MNDSKRRSTLQPAADFNGASRSNLPVPGTLKKPTANLRQSMAGSAMRGPYPTPMLAPPTNPRQSMYRSQNVNPLLMSAVKQGVGRTPMASTRRGSMWGGPPAAAASSVTQSTKDTRPLRDKHYQTKMRTDILNYLQTAGFEIMMATLTNIQGKDYRAIFNYLLSILEPAFPLNPSLRFEEEFVPALKALRYPYAHQIDNKWLAAPASMHSWPSLLGVLHWLVEACKIQEAYLSSGHPTLQDPSLVPEEFDDAFDHAALAFDYYEQSYLVWLDGQDEFPEANQALEERYLRKNETVRLDLEETALKLSQAKSELHKLESSAAPIAQLQKEHGMLKVDSEKFQEILHRYEGRKKKLIDTIAFEKAELATRGAHLEQLQAEQATLADTVKQQNLTPEEVIRMNTEHETLSRNLEDLKQKIAEAHRTVLSLEVNVTNRAAAAEEAIDAYTNLLSSLDLFPPLPPPVQNVDLTLELNTAASSPLHLLAGADIRKVVKPTLSSIAELKRSERATVESERIKLDNELDQLSVECENLDEEIAELEKKVAVLNEQADDLRDAAQQDAMVSNAEAARLERDLAQARTAALSSGMGVKSRLQALQFNYREQIEKVSRLKEETVRAMMKNINDICMFKQEVSRHLTELQQFAAED
ncbi:hypothetical protein HGRIS_013270 [Hohenbuehelia grisea]|uniref:Kinetochore protein NDC80 n=1 Tax=Hohenbuehelia grisea TaxID=104357 RepID=A0ABR3IV19_9AGAR